jgi:hypothetical protein
VLFGLRADLLVRFRILDAGWMFYDVASWILRLENREEVKVGSDEGYS